MALSQDFQPLYKEDTEVAEESPLQLARRDLHSSQGVAVRKFNEEEAKQDWESPGGSREHFSCSAS